VALVLAFGKQNIFELVGEASVIGLVTIFIPFCASLFFNHSNKTGAIFSMIAGTMVYVLFKFVHFYDINPLLPGLIASLLGIFAGDWVSKQLKKCV